MYKPFSGPLYRNQKFLGKRNDTCGRINPFISKESINLQRLVGIHACWEGRLVYIEGLAKCNQVLRSVGRNVRASLHFQCVVKQRTLRHCSCTTLRIHVHHLQLTLDPRRRICYFTGINFKMVIKAWFLPILTNFLNRNCTEMGPRLREFRLLTPSGCRLRAHAT